jgi:hypothetical protein
MGKLGMLGYLRKQCTDRREKGKRKSSADFDDRAEKC